MLSWASSVTPGNAGTRLQQLRLPKSYVLPQTPNPTVCQLLAAFEFTDTPSLIAKSTPRVPGGCSPSRFPCSRPCPYSIFALVWCAGCTSTRRQQPSGAKGSAIPVKHNHHAPLMPTARSVTVSTRRGCSQMNKTCRFLHQGGLRL